MTEELTFAWQLRQHASLPLGGSEYIWQSTVCPDLTMRQFRKHARMRAVETYFLDGNEIPHDEAMELVREHSKK